MALLLKNGAVFLHIPKTGGNWVTEVLYNLDLVEENVAAKHADIDRYFSYPGKTRISIIKLALKELLSFPKKEPFMFCFVRNPISWYESWFKYMSQPTRNWRDWGGENSIYGWHPNRMLNGVEADSFNELIENMIKKRPGYVTEMYGWYTEPPMRFIGKQENLANDLIEVLKIMNLNFDEEYVRNYKKVGVSPKPSKEIVWDPDLKRKVTLLEYAGLVRYGYCDGEDIQIREGSLS